MSETPFTAATPTPIDYARPPAATPSKAALWTGRVMTGLIALAIGAGGVTDLFKPPFVVEGVTRAGYPESCIVPLGVVVVLSTVLFLIPRTMLIGAVMFTAYLGGAVATHVRMSEFGPMWMPVAFGVVFWVGLLLREPRVRAFFLRA